MCQSTCSNNKQTNAENQLHQLSFDKDTMFPGIANIVQLKDSRKFGKHLITRENIDVGQILMAAAPYASIEYLIRTGTGCFQCGKPSEFKMQCPNCIDVWFCSTSCRRSQWHESKCNRSFVRDDSKIIRLVTEIITVACKAIGDIDLFLEFCRRPLFSDKSLKKCQPPFSQYGELLTLKGHPVPCNASKAHRVVKHIMNMEPFESSSMNTGESSIPPR